MKHGCKCGALQITDAGYQQMTFAERTEWKRKVAACETCKRDRRAGR